MLFPVTMLPLGLAALGLVATGRSGRATALWRHARARVFGGPTDTTAGAAGRVAGHGLVSAVFGVVGLVELGLFGLFVARGLLYGLVDHGPYDHSWGGPTLAGAWAVHAAVGFGVAIAAGVLGVAVTALHGRLTDGLLGGRRVPGRVVAVSTGLTLGVALLLVAFVRQL